MEIIVTIKQVADPNIPPSHIKLDADGKRIISPFGIPPVMNGYDANALEAALQLREKHGGRISVVGLGDDSSREALKYAIAMGANSAVLLNDRDWLHADSAGVAQALAAAIRKIGKFDLLLSGRQASDTDGGQVIYYIAEAFKLPAVAPILKIEASDEKCVVVHRLIEDGYQRLRVQLPAVLGISSETNEPRYPPVKGKMAAGRTMIPGWKAADIGLGAVSPKVELRRLQIQVRDARAELIPGASAAEQGAALADKLHEAGLL